MPLKRVSKKETVEQRTLRHEETHAAIGRVAKRAGKTSTQNLNREAWLNACVDIFRDEFKAAGSPIPETVRISVGFTGLKRKGVEALGACWDSDQTEDNVHEVFISPVATGIPLNIAGIVCHELVHAALPAGTGHKKAFAVLADAVGLEGQPRHKINGPDFEDRYGAAVEALGPFPGKALVPKSRNRSAGEGGNKKRKMKAVCENCEMNFRIASKWVTPEMQCPDRECGGNLTVEEM